MIHWRRETGNKFLISIHLKFNQFAGLAARSVFDLQEQFVFAIGQAGFADLNTLLGDFGHVEQALGNVDLKAAVKHPETFRFDRAGCCGLEFHTDGCG